MGEDKSAVIHAALYGQGGLREKALAEVRRTRDEAKLDLGGNEIPDLTAYMVVSHLRDLIFAVHLDGSNTWEDALEDVRMRAGNRLLQVTDPSVPCSPHEAFRRVCEANAIAKFLSNTRALMR